MHRDRDLEGVARRVKVAPRDLQRWRAGVGAQFLTQGLAERDGIHVLPDARDTPAVAGLDHAALARRQLAQGALDVLGEQSERAGLLAQVLYKFD